MPGGLLGRRPPVHPGSCVSPCLGNWEWESPHLEMEEQTPFPNPSQELKASPNPPQSSRPLEAMGLTTPFCRVWERRRNSHKRACGPMAELWPEQLSPGQEARSE